MIEMNTEPLQRPTPLPAGDSVNRTWLRALEATADLGEHSHCTLPRIIDEIAEKSGDAPALISKTTTLTYAQLAALSNRYARWALAEGVRVGATICLDLHNCPDYIAIWLGITRVGGVVALVNNTLTGAALAHCIDIVSPIHVIVGKQRSAEYESAMAGADRAHKLWIHDDSTTRASTPINVTVKRFSGHPLSAGERRLVTLSHLALRIYTSGTTGRPKAANVSHHRIVMWSKWFAGLLGASPSDRMYDCLPLYHGVGGIVATGAMLVSGGSVVMREKFSATQFWRDVAETECTLFQYFGELCRHLLNGPSSPDERRHKLRLCCGNGMRPDVWEKFCERFQIPKIFEFYAATEGNFSLFNVEGRTGSIGRVPLFLAHRFPVSLVLVDPVAGEPVRDGRGRCVKAAENEVGEAIARINADSSGIFGRFEGYSNSAETEKKILRDVFDRSDVWFRTGDLMRRDAQGFYYFVNRIGDTYRWKGENVATLEVEESLCRCAGVCDANVYSVEAPQCEGRAGMAALVIDENFDFSTLQQHVIADLPDYARPVFIRLRKEMEVTETFKHKKSDLAAQGYDPRIMSDALYYFNRVRSQYVALDRRQFSSINAGLMRL
jgi:fatty-acyl-CoA synthase